MALLCCLRLLYSSISVKTSITLRLMGVSLSWMNRLGIELPIGSRGMGGGTKISQQEITKFMAKIMRDQERI